MTLDQKITIKGELAMKRVPPAHLARLTPREACWLYWRCFGRPATTVNNPKRWRPASRRCK